MNFLSDCTTAYENNIQCHNGGREKWEVLLPSSGETKGKIKQEKKEKRADERTKRSEKYAGRWSWRFHR